MNLSLKDQLLKAGLVNEKKLKKAKKGSKKSRTQAREAKAAVEENRQAQLERDVALNKEREQAKLAKEIQAQVKQLIAMNKITDSDGDVKYNFTDEALVKSFYINEATHKQLVKGNLSIARDGESYAIIPTVVANKIEERSQDFVIQNNTPTEDAVDEDDPYKDFVVPDDLMW